MKKLKYILLAALLISIAASVSGVPEIPHHVYGDISDTDGPVNDINVSFYHDGSMIESTLTDSTGYYDIKIPYSSDYDGENLDVYTENINTGKDVTFSQGSSTEVNYEGRNIVKEDFTVSGTVTENDNAVSDASIDLYNDGSSIASTSTDSNGDYSVSISFDDSYDNETLTLYVDGSDTGETTTFKTRGSATLDHSTSTETNNNNNNDNEEENDKAGGSTDTTDEDDDSDTSDSDSDSGDDEAEAVIEVTDISSAPQNPEAGETVTFYVTVTNSGETSGTQDISLKIGDEELEQTVEDLSAGDIELIEFQKVFDSENTYEASIGGQSLDVNVVASESEETQQEEKDEGGGISFIQIMGIVGGLLMLVVVIYLFFDSRKKNDMDEEQKGALDAFKEKKAKEKGESDGFGWKYADED